MPITDEGNWINTFSGRQFWPLNPRVEDVCLEDIAHALSNQCRFPNEAALIKQLGGEVWRVERPSLGPALDLHPSETSLDDYAFDHVIVNNGSLEDLYRKVKDLVRP